MRQVSPLRFRLALLSRIAALMSAPGLALAQASPFFDRGHLPSNQHSRLADPGRDHPGDGARRHGDGESPASTFCAPPWRATPSSTARGTGFWVDGWKPRDTRQLKDAMFSGV